MQEFNKLNAADLRIQFSEYQSWLENPSACDELTPPLPAKLPTPLSESNSSLVSTLLSESNSSQVSAAADMQASSKDDMPQSTIIVSCILGAALLALIGGAVWAMWSRREGIINTTVMQLEQSLPGRRRWQQKAQLGTVHVSEETPQLLLPAHEAHSHESGRNAQHSGASTTQAANAGMVSGKCVDTESDCGTADTLSESGFELTPLRPHPDRIKLQKQDRKIAGGTFRPSNLQWDVRKARRQILHQVRVSGLIKITKIRELLIIRKLYERSTGVLLP